MNKIIPKVIAKELYWSGCGRYILHKYVLARRQLSLEMAEEQLIKDLKRAITKYHQRYYYEVPQHPGHMSAVIKEVWKHMVFISKNYYRQVPDSWEIDEGNE